MPCPGSHHRSCLAPSPEHGPLCWYGELALAFWGGWGGWRRAGLLSVSPFVLPAWGGDPAGKSALGTGKGQPRGTSRTQWISGWAKLWSVKSIPQFWLRPTSCTASSLPALSSAPHPTAQSESQLLSPSDQPQTVPARGIKPSSGSPARARPRQEPHQYFRKQPGSPGSSRGPADQ